MYHKMHVISICFKKCIHLSDPVSYQDIVYFMQKTPCAPYQSFIPRNNHSSGFSLRIMSLRLTQIATYLSSDIPLYDAFILRLMRMRCFQSGAFIGKVALNSLAQGFLWTYVFISFGKYTSFILNLRWKSKHR